MDRRRPTGEHPEDLMWYVAGTLDDHRTRSIERHLDGCEACRIEVEDLSEVRGAVLDEADEHVPGERLIRFANGENRDPRSRAEIERHVSGCAGCRDDLSHLRRIGLETAGARTPTDEAVRGGRLRNLIAVAAAIVLMLGLGSIVTWWPSGTTVPTSESRSSVTLLPTYRSGHLPVVEAGEILTMTIALPAAAPGGAYDVRLMTDDGTTVMKSSVGSNADHNLSVRVEGLAPGKHRFVVRAQGDPDGDEYVYPFRATEPGADASAPR